jgi:hypothetical protein
MGRKDSIKRMGCQLVVRTEIGFQFGSRLSLHLSACRFVVYLAHPYSGHP